MGILKRFWQKIVNLFVKTPALPQLPKEQIDETLWLTIAKKEIGVKEVAGEGNNARVLQYHAATKLKANADSVPWCSSFVSWCLQEAGYKSTRDAWARSYLQYGEKLSEPKYGCIVVFDRGNGNGHVGFHLYEKDGLVFVVGGNQRDAVNISSYSKENVLGYVWPVKA